MLITQITNIDQYIDIMDEVKSSKSDVYINNVKRDRRRVFSKNAQEDMEDILDSNVKVVYSWTKGIFCLSY